MFNYRINISLFQLNTSQCFKYSSRSNYCLFSASGLCGAGSRDRGGGARGDPLVSGDDWLGQQTVNLDRGGPLNGGSSVDARVLETAPGGVARGGPRDGYFRSRPDLATAVSPRLLIVQRIGRNV